MKFYGPYCYLDEDNIFHVLTMWTHNCLLQNFIEKEYIFWKQGGI